ncbi:MAG: Mur ligase family protein [Bacteroidota bacterium]
MFDLELVKELGGTIVGDIDVAKITDIHNMYQEITIGSIYIAIKGANQDGINFVQQAIDRGAIAIITHKKIDINIPQIVVDNTVNFVIRYATKKINQYKNKIIGVVGSVGKTTLRHTLISLLPGKKIYTIKSFNNKFSISMSMMLLDNNYDFAIIEMGTNFPGEILDLSKMIEPDYVLINTIGLEHSEFLGGLKDILKEEYSVLKHTKKMSISSLNNKSILEEYESMDLLNDKIENYFLPSYQKSGNKIEIMIDGKIVEFEINSRDFALINTVIFTIFLANKLGLDINEIIEKTKNLHNVCHRNSLIKVGNLRIFDCSFNCNPTSFYNLINNIENKCSLFFGQMKELGIFSKEEHYKCFEKIYENPLIENAYIISDFVIPDEFNSKIKKFKQTDINEITGDVYIQGSRSSKMENIVFQLINLSFFSLYKSIKGNDFTERFIFH